MKGTQKKKLGRPGRDRCCRVIRKGLILHFHRLHSAGISCARYDIAGEFGPLMSTGITCSTSARNKQSQPDNQQCQQFPSQDKNTQIKPTATSPLPGGQCPAAKLLPENLRNTLRLKGSPTAVHELKSTCVWATCHEKNPSLLSFPLRKCRNAEQKKIAQTTALLLQDGGAAIRVTPQTACDADSRGKEVWGPSFRNTHPLPLRTANTSKPAVFDPNPE